MKKFIKKLVDYVHTAYLKCMHTILAVYHFIISAPAVAITKSFDNALDLTPRSKPATTVTKEQSDFIGTMATLIIFINLFSSNVVSITVAGWLFILLTNIFMIINYYKQPAADAAIEAVVDNEVVAA